MCSRSNMDHSLVHTSHSELEHISFNEILLHQQLKKEKSLPTDPVFPDEFLFVKDSNRQYRDSDHDSYYY
ncbi:hypothetical protein C0J52_18447 [Blattella germanica]|nr:hypothetical protein C0J52_18447 [Blattella germanica]